eukprot:NODE_112_length_19362_cov_0.399678.p10 type:complete len:141 gc:universal NODE_112_length_19362_cov_0.399678:18802-19224(+)
MRQKSHDYKETAVRHYIEQSHNMEVTCRIFDCKIKTLGRWIQRYREDGNIERHNRIPRANKMKQSHVDEAVNYLANHQTVSIPELDTHLEDKYNDYLITGDHLRTVIRDKNITRKRTKHGDYPKLRRRKVTDRKADLLAF